MAWWINIRVLSVLLNVLIEIQNPIISKFKWSKVEKGQWWPRIQRTSDVPLCRRPEKSYSWPGLLLQPRLTVLLIQTLRHNQWYRPRFRRGLSSEILLKISDNGVESAQSLHHFLIVASALDRWPTSHLSTHLHINLPDLGALR